MDVLPLVWPVLVALAAFEVHARRGAPAVDVREAELRRGGWVAVLVIALTMGVVRASLSVGRDFHNVDEAQYAASADHARRTGESLFGPRNLGGHQWLFLLGSLDDPYTAVDLATSAAVAATGALLGLAILRARADGLAARLAPVLYLLSMARLEGGSANKEAWVGLCAAGWVYVRLRPGGTTWRRQVAGGACLGLAVLMKEQAGPLVLAEGALLAYDAARERAWAPGLRHGLWAATGFWLGLSPLLVGLAAHGALVGYFAFLRDMGSHGGQPVLDLCRVLGVAPPPAAEPLPLAERVAGLFLGLTPIASAPVGFLGLWSVGRLVGEARRARGWSDEVLAALRLEVGLAALALAGAGAASIGERWFAHYLLLAGPGLTGLAALRAADLWRAGLGPAPARAPLLAGAAFALLLTLFNGLLVLSYPPAWEGEGVGEPDRTPLRLVGASVRRLTPADGTLFVWGWRPELYLESCRHPASRYACGLTATMAELMADLRRERPATIVLPGLRGLAASEEFDPYDLARHPELEAWLRAEGYAPAARVEDYVILTRRAR
jgi:hypothetical protein